MSTTRISVPYCAICKNLSEYTQQHDLAEGDYCPVCNRPVCRQHLTTVRFYWRETRSSDSSLVCKDCKTGYKHRYWDTARRDWIS